LEKRLSKKFVTQPFTIVIPVFFSLLFLTSPVGVAAQQSSSASDLAQSAAQPAPQITTSQDTDPQSDSSSKPASSGQNPAPAASPQTSTDQTSADKAAQDQNKDKSKDKTAQDTNGQGKNAGTSKAGTSNDRLFLALPNFLTLEGSAKVPPLTTGQKFKVVARGAFDKVQLPWYLSLAAISQAENSEPGYGQGWEGYGKRFASAFADGAIENFMTSAVFASLLHQDPRFFQFSEGGVAHRAGYAISRIVVTRTDSGRSQFNYSEVFGSAVAAAISTNTYHPRAFITTRYDPTTNSVIYVHNASDRTLPNTASVWGTQMGYDALTYVIKEFWPDIHRKMAKKHEKPVALQPANSAATPNP
jgi:hypothetical protein